MSDRRFSIIYSGIAGITLACGIALAVGCFLDYKEAGQRNTKKARDFAELRRLKQRAAGLEAQLVPLRKIKSGPLPNVEKLVRSIFSGNEIEDIRQNSIGSIDVFTLVNTEVALKDIELSKIRSFVETLESLRPPIRLTYCEITPLESRPGLGNAAIRLQSIQKNK